MATTKSCDLPTGESSARPGSSVIPLASRQYRRARLTIAAVGLLACLGAFAARASAATYTVGTTSDTAVGVPCAIRRFPVSAPYGS